MVNVSSLETSLSSSEASLFRSEGGDTEKRKRADHDALATFSIIVIFNGLPSRSLCGGEKWRVVSSNRKVFFATFALDKVDQCEGNPRQSLDSGSTPWIPDSLSLELGFRIPKPSISHSTRQISRIPSTGFRIYCEWNLDSGFQSLVGFRIPWAVHRIPKPRKPDSTAKLCWIPNPTSENLTDSVIWIPLHRANS